MVKSAIALLALSGCSLITDSFEQNDFSGDPFPTNVDTRSGAVLAGLRSGGEDFIAVVDIMSPFTVIDPGANVDATIDSEDLTLLGDHLGVVGVPDLPRGSFPSQQVLRNHPCPRGVPTCVVGTPAFEQPFGAILGADALAGDALRLRVGDNQMFVFADIGGSNADRTYACDAVFPSPFRGGGTLIVADTEVPFAGRRVTIQACLDADPRIDVTQAARGTDTLFVLSSMIGPSLISASAYERYRQTRNTPPLSVLPVKEVALPSELPEGKVRGGSITIDRLSLVARSSSETLAPCRQVYASEILVDRDCNDADPDCPCEDNNSFCPVPATVRVEPAAGIELLVVPDDNATLQALRTEFRPSLQEIDGILGTGAMGVIELDIDYPHNRVLARCSTDDPLRCQTRPALDDRNDRNQIRGCLGLPR
jgi:hypothetical protein